MAITLLADSLAPTTARPSAGTLLTTATNTHI